MDHEHETGSLVVVGCGIKLVGHMTHEAKLLVERADHVFYVVHDTAVGRWLERLNPRAESLHALYAEGKPRLETYREMVEAILSRVRAGQQVCAVFYGHPGIFVTPSLRALDLAREEGYPARMLPGISAEDCLFADLEVDPAARGCQSYEATDFLLRPRSFDPRVPLVLWQIGVIGEANAASDEPNRHGLGVLADRLLEIYPTDHQVVIYVAAAHAIHDPVIHRVALVELPNTELSTMATLYVPPHGEPPFDERMAERLRISTQC